LPICLSISDQFFLHGDSKVCATVDVQRHDDIFHLTREDLEQSSPSDVILAPYGLTGKLIGLIDRDVDLHQLRENWKRNYPLEQLDGLPEFVQVTAGPLRMFYPTCFVYKTSRIAPHEMKRNTSDRSAINKQIAMNILLNAQRTNSLDQEKKIDHPSVRRHCDCSSITSRPSTTTNPIPFHRRPRPPSTHFPSESITTLDPMGTLLPPPPPPSASSLSFSPQSTIVTTNSTNEEKSNPTIVPLGTTMTTTTTTLTTTMMMSKSPLNHSPLNRTTTTTEININGKRPLAMVLDDWKIDNGDDGKEQTYDFTFTDNLLQSIFKRMRTEETTTIDPLYRHGQPTPPSPPQTTVVFDEPSIAIDGPSMDDLATIFEPTDPLEGKKESLPVKISSTESNPPSSPLSRKEVPVIRSSLYDTPPGSSSSDKFQTLHSPYGITVETSSPFDSIQESILVPFENQIILEQSIYHPLNKVSLSSKSSSLRYDPSAHFRQRSNKNRSEFIPRPFHQLTPSSHSTASLFSPRNSTDPSSNDLHSTNNVSPSDVDSFLFNSILNDSLLNLFRDINFDSCVACACSSKLSIHGQDSMIYLDQHLPQSSSRTITSINNRLNDCSCGFSAAVNLRLSLQSGLFYEDEIDITGLKIEVKYRDVKEKLSGPLLNLIERRESFFSPFTESIRQTIPTKVRSDRKHPFHRYENDVCGMAIEQSRQTSSTMSIDLTTNEWFHPWSFSFTSLDSDQQLISMLRSLQPLLTEALRRRPMGRLSTTIEGPLTWKSFHHLLHVQNQHAHLEEQSCGPQPIPNLLTGFDREWITLAPYGLKFWDKLTLEPYSKRKDLCYVVIQPDNEYLSTMTKFYLRELSSSYELCRLGSHRPWTKIFPDQGILKLTEGTAETRSIEVDQWFNEQEMIHPLGKRLKHCLQYLKEKLRSYLSHSTFEQNLIDEHSSRRETSRYANDLSSPSDLHHSSNDHFNSNHLPSPSSSSSSSSTLLNHINGSMSNDSMMNHTGSATTTITNNALSTSASQQQPHIDPADVQSYEAFYHGRSLNDDQIFFVIYFVDTFRYDFINEENRSFDEQIEIYIKKSLLRLYLDLIKDLPEKTINRIHFQIIPLESILQHQIEVDGELRLTHFKRLSFHIYEQLKRTICHTTRAKSLTGLGPSASEDKMPSQIVMQFYTPAYILSPKWDFRYKSFVDPTEQTNLNGSILYCSYCLSDDQRYILVSCSDERGELKETCSINIEIADRHQKKVQYAARHGLKRVWDFILHIVTSTTMPWRIVIGRLGRLGHGELKYWGIILSKKNLVRYATAIRDDCAMCRNLRNHDHPMILSACFISFETHPLLRILPESLELGEIRGAQASNNNNTNLSNNGQILNDISVTHILTLPTSASIQLNSGPHLNDSRQFSNENDDDFFGVFLKDTLLIDDFDPGPASPSDVDGTGNHLDASFPNGQYFNRLNSFQTSTTQMNSTHHHSTTNSHSNVHRSHHTSTFDQEIDMNESPSLSQQPLALGFYVSTIGSLNPLPSWMSSTSKSSRSSSVFKATLHINVPNAQHSDDMLFAQNHEHKSQHPLDSNFTYVVLRHVLESYHRLSWLLIDTKSNERASCLPIHLETLLRLYQAFKKYV